jgi:tyrosine-protein kinase
VREESVEQKDFRDYLRPLLRRWWLIVAIVPIVTIGTYLYYSHKPKAYAASTELYVQPSIVNQLLVGSNGNSFNPLTVENLSILIQTRAVASLAAKELAKTHSPVAGSISATPVGKESNFIDITATAPTPRGAVLLANAYATAFVATQTQQVHGEASKTLRTAQRQLSHLGTGPAATAQRQALEEKIQTLQLISSQGAGGSGIKQIEPATAASLTATSPTSRAIFALVISLMLALGAAYGLEYLNRKITSVEGAEEAFELPVLSEVPNVDDPAPFDASGVGVPHELHESFHRLQMNLDMLSHERPLRTILVASAAPGEGKSIVARNLALAYREAGRNVAVLDADFRKGTLGHLLSAQDGPGLTDILAGRATFGQAVQEVSVPANSNGNGAAGSHAAVAVVAGATGAIAQTGGITHGDLAIVPAGLHHGNLASALGSGGLREALAAAAEAYDTVIIDSSPLLAAADVLPLLSEADGVVLVARLGVSTRDSAKRLLRELQRVPNIHVVGVVANGIPPRTYRSRAYGYYYG